MWFLVVEGEDEDTSGAVMVEILLKLQMFNRGEVVDVFEFNWMDTFIILLQIIR